MSYQCHSQVIDKNEDAFLNTEDLVTEEQFTCVKVVVLWLSDETDLKVPDQEGKQWKSNKPLLMPAKALNIGRNKIFCKLCGYLDLRVSFLQIVLKF